MQDNYFSRIEDFARRFLFRSLSPLEWAYVEAWQEAGFSEHVVCTGILRAFQNYKPKFKGDRIRSLLYCEPVIVATAQEQASLDFWSQRCWQQNAKEPN